MAVRSSSPSPVEVKLRKEVRVEFPDDQIQELKAIYGDGIKKIVDLGFPYFLIPNLQLPDGCTPGVVDGLLCPVQKDNYASRLFVSEKVQFQGKANWNGNVRVGGRNWFAVSWKTVGSLRLSQMVVVHLGAFR